MYAQELFQQCGGDRRSGADRRLLFDEPGSSPEDRARAKQDVDTFTVGRGSMMQEARQERIVPLLLYLFTAVTGLIDAVSYIALGHIFTANMAVISCFLALL